MQRKRPWVAQHPGLVRDAGHLHLSSFSAETFNGTDEADGSHGADEADVRW
jgi:hypothetical protein